MIWKPNWPLHIPQPQVFCDSYIKLTKPHHWCHQCKHTHTHLQMLAIGLEKLDLFLRNFLLDDYGIAHSKSWWQVCGQQCWFGPNSSTKRYTGCRPSLWWVLGPPLAFRLSLIPGEWVIRGAQGGGGISFLAPWAHTRERSLERDEGQMFPGWLLISAYTSLEIKRFLF